MSPRFSYSCTLMLPIILIMTHDNSVCVIPLLWRSWWVQVCRHTWMTSWLQKGMCLIIHPAKIHDKSSVCRMSWNTLCCTFGMCSTVSNRHASRGLQGKWDLKRKKGKQKEKNRHYTYYSQWSPLTPKIQYQICYSVK